MNKFPRIIFNNILPATFKDSLTYLEQLRCLRDKLNEVIDEVNAITEGGGSGYILPQATAEKLGGIKVGENLSITDDGVLNAEAGGSEYELPISSKTVLGGVKMGDNTGVQVNSDGVISLSKEIPDPYTLPVASRTTLGGVKQGDNTDVQIDNNGIISLKKEIPDPYTLPKASKSILGGIKVGANLTIDSDGTLNASSGGSVEPYTLPISTKETLGGVKQGDNTGLQVNSDGVISLTKEIPDPYTLPLASKTTLGGVKIGENLTITEDGTLNASGSAVDPYQLPISSKTVLGGVKQGDNTGLQVDSSGIISLTKEIPDPYTLPQATTEELGGIKLGKGLKVNGEDKTFIDIGDGLAYTVKDGEEKITVDINENKGLEFDSQGLALKLGTNLSFGDNGEINAIGGTVDPYTLPVASKTVLGGIKVGENLTITEDGVLNASGGGTVDPYTLPIASKDTLGGVKMGDNTGLQVDSSGIISLTKEIPDPYKLPKADYTELGGIVIGKYLELDRLSGATNVLIGKGLISQDEENQRSKISINLGNGLMFDENGRLTLKLGAGLKFNETGEIVVDSIPTPAQTTGIQDSVYNIKTEETKKDSYDTITTSDGFSYKITK